MAKRLAVPESQIAVVPLGINMKGYRAAAARRAASFVSDTSRGSHLRRGCMRWPMRYIHFRKRTGAASDIRLEAAGYLSRADTPVFRERQTPAGSRRRWREFTYRGAVDRDGKLAFLQTLDVLSVPGAIRRAEGRVPAGGDGERRAGRAAAPRRVHRDRREDRRRPAGRSGRSEGARRRRCSSCGRTARRPATLGDADSEASARITASRIPPIDFSRCVPR